MTYLPTLAVLALSVLFGIYQLANFPPTEEIETYSVLSEAAVTFLALMGLFLVQKLRPFKEIYAPFMVGSPRSSCPCLRTFSTSFWSSRT